MDQLSALVDRTSSSQAKIALFRSLFRGRKDVHPVDSRATKHTGRIIALGSRDVTIDDANQNTRWSGVPYAAIDLREEAGTVEVEILEAAEPTPILKRRTRADFKIGDNVSFVDRDQQTHVGRVVRLNAKTATLECDSGTWRVGFGLLQHLVDI